MITLAYLDAQTLLDRAADVRHPSPVARSVHRWVTAWTIVADLMRAGAR